MADQRGSSTDEGEEHHELIVSHEIVMEDNGTFTLTVEFTGCPTHAFARTINGMVKDAFRDMIDVPVPLDHEH